MSYIRQRMTQAVVTLYAVVTLGFFLNKLLPGGPIDFLTQDMYENPGKYGLPDPPTDSMVRRTITQMVEIPPDKPLSQAYVDYMYNVFFRFDLGESIIVDSNAAVEQLILSAAPWTIFISTLGLIYGLIVGIMLGALMAYYEGTKFDVGMTVAMILDSAVPYYAVALMLLFFLGFQWQVFPATGRVDPNVTPGLNWAFIASVFNHATLPALSFILTGFGGGALGLRANAIRLLGEGYIRVAEIRGLSRYRIATAYLARNAILPMWTGIVIGIGGLLGGSIIMEEIFQYYGMGRLMFQATIARDFPVLMGGFIIFTVLFVVGTILADFTYAMVDPRADVKAER